MYPKWAVFPLMAVCLTLASCIPVSEKPLSDPASSEPDARFLGLWRVTDPNGTVTYVHVGTETEEPIDTSRSVPEPGLMRFEMVTHYADDGRIGDAASLRFFNTKIGDDVYLNLIGRQKDLEESHEQNPKYLFFKCHVRGDEIDVWPMDFKATGTVVENGKLKGEVKYRDGELNEVRLTGTGQEMRDFLANGGDKQVFLEKSKAVYKRVP